MKDPLARANARERIPSNPLTGLLFPAKFSVNMRLSVMIPVYRERTARERIPFQAEEVEQGCGRPATR